MPIQLSGSLVITGSITTTGVITMSGSIASATSASYSSTSDLLQGTGSVGFATTASLLTVSSSQQQISASQQQISSSLLRISSSYASTGSNTFTGIQNFSNTCTPNSFTAGASIYTAGGLQVTQDTYFSSSVYIKGNVTVYGTQSVSYVSSSQFNIGTNIITVNTFTPSVRYGGLSVFDSGSTGLTGSIFWDSELNRWIYVNASGSGGGDTYGGGMFISGPRNSQGIGCEQGTTACMLLVGQGGDHLTSSLVYHSSTVTCIPNAIVGGSTISGTTIYGSTAVCSAVGKFTTCLDLGGALTGTSATLSGLLTLSSGAGTKAVWATTRNFGVNRNFQIAVDEYAESAFTITPSTTLGGSSYTTPIFTLAAAGAATFACSVQSNYLSSVISSSSNASPLILQNTAGWASSQISSITVKDGSSAVGAIGWKYDGVGNVDMLFHSLYNGAYKTTSDVVMTVKGTGNIGIGTTSPASKLSIGGDGYAGRAITAIANNADFGVTIRQDSASGAGLQIFTSQTSWGSTPLTIATSNTTLLSIASTGAATFSNVVNISKASDSDYLALKIENRPITDNNTSSGFIAFYQNPGNGSNNTISSGRIYGKFDTNSYASARLTFSTVTGFDEYQDVMTLKYGNVGIGTTSPLTKLDIRGTSASAAATLQIVGNSVSTLLLGQNSSGGVIRGQGGSDALSFWTGGSGDTGAGSSGTEKMRITSIGTLKMAATTISNNNATFGATDNGGYQYFQGDLANGEKFGSQGGTYIQGFYFISWYSTSGRGYAIYATVSPAANAGTVLASSGGWAAASATYNASSAISLAFDGSVRGPVLSNNTGTTVTFYSYVFGGT